MRNNNNMGFLVSSRTPNASVKDVKTIDCRTASIEEISSILGVSPLVAREIQMMERGQYDGDVQAVDLEGNRLPLDEDGDPIILTHQ